MVSYYLMHEDDRTIHKKPVETDNGDGTKNITIGFPVCEAFDGIDVQSLVDVLNEHSTLRERLASAEAALQFCQQFCESEAENRGRYEHGEYWRGAAAPRDAAAAHFAKYAEPADG